MTPKRIAEVSGPHAAAWGSFRTLTDRFDIRRVEQIIAVARVVVSLGVSQTVRMAPIPSRQFEIASDILLAYSGLATILLVVLLRRRTVPPWLPATAQAVDVFFPIVLVSVSGLSGPLAIFLLFPLLAAGYRWGFPEVMLSAVAIDALLAGQYVLARSRPDLLRAAAPEQIELNSLVINGMFVAITGVVVGYFSENEHRRRSEAAAVARVAAQAEPGAQFNETLHQLLNSVRDVFGGRQVLLVLQDAKVGRAFSWSAGGSEATEPATAKELSDAVRDHYLFPAPGAAWHAVAHRFWRRGRFNAIAIDELGGRLPAVNLDVPAGFVIAHRCRRVLGVALTFGEEWNGRLFIIDPALGIHRDLNARFALRLATHAGHVMYSNYLVHRVRMRAKASERGRIARELHDGLTQSLLGLEMQLAAVRRRVIAEAPQIDGDLSKIHNALRNEITTLRELMEGIQAGNRPSGDIMEELAEMVERFKRYTGIAARFEAIQPPLGASPPVRRQIARILHEALVNVRKHSNAKRVAVRAEGVDGRWRLSIEDDGHGFPFAGRRTQAELDELKQGPRMIRERVRLIGGELIVESRPGSSARVEVLIPLPRHD